MKRTANSITKMILAAAILFAAAFVYTGTEADAIQTHLLQVGQCYPLGTSTVTPMNGGQQIVPRDNVFGDKFPYRGEYYYNGSEHPNTVATFIDPDISDYNKYYKYDINITYATRVQTWQEGILDGYWGPVYDLPRGYYDDDGGFYCLYLVPGSYFERPRELHFYMEDRGEPWGVQVLSGDGTKEHPIRFGLLFSEPYSVGFNPIEHGTASAHPNAEEGEKVELDLAPDYGYETDRVTVKRADNGAAVEVTSENGKYSFVMPRADVTVDVRFKFDPELTLVARITGSDGAVESYDDFAAALGNWKDGSTLTLLDGVSIDTPIDVTGDKTLDLNGYVLEADGKAFAINGGSLTINDSAPDRETNIRDKNYTGGQLFGSVDGCVDNKPAAEAVINVTNGSLTINGGTFDNRQSENGSPTWTIAAGKDAKVRINDGEFNAFKTIAIGTNAGVSVELAGGKYNAIPTLQDMECWPIVWTNGNKDANAVKVTGGYYVFDPEGIESEYITIDPLPIADGYQSEEKNGQPDWKWDDFQYRVVGSPYDITIDENIENGMIRAPEGAKLGEKVTLTAAPAEHYRLKNYIVKDTDGKDIEVSDGAFTMPNSAVTVSAEFEGIPVSKLRLNKVRVTLDEDGFEMIRVAVTPSDALNKEVSWQSANTSIATVDNDGLISAVGVGKTKVTATAVGSGVSVSCVVTVQHIHRMTKVDSTDANCVTEGNIEYWKCDLGEHACGRLFADEKGENEIVLSDTVIPIDGERHGQISEPGFETVTETISYRTCTTPLNQKRVTRCRDCGAVISISPNGEAAYGHDWGEWETIKEPTATECGKERRICKRDPTHTETRIIPALQHSHILTKVEAKAATCTKQGNREYWVCDGGEQRCLHLFADAEGKTEIDKESITLRPIGHKPGRGVRENEREATCEEAASYDMVFYCTREGCGAEMSRATNTEGNALGHIWSTFEDAGDGTHKKVCSRDSSHVATEAHRWDAGRNIAPTCQRGGKTVYTCIDCGYTEDRNEVGPDPDAHEYDDASYQWNEDNSKVTATHTCPHDGAVETETADVIAYETAPTCAKDGFTTYLANFKNNDFARQTKEFPGEKATGHKWNAGKVTRKATVSKGGEKTYTCTVCQETKTADIAKAGTVIKGRTVTLKAAKLRKKSRAVARKTAITLKKTKGTVTFTKAKGNKKFVINKKTGRITAKKGLKKGTYKLKVKVTCAGNASYQAYAKKVTVTIKVR